MTKESWENMLLDFAKQQQQQNNSKNPFCTTVELINIFNCFDKDLTLHC